MTRWARTFVAVAGVLMTVTGCLAQQTAVVPATATAPVTTASARRPKLPKQVYALYFPHHRNREHDGRLGAWQKSLTAEQSKAEKTYFNYNPDLIDANGRHQIAATVYPYLGMQSDMDSDYQEFQILQAKVAHIDAFIVDWILPGNYGWEHCLRKLLKTAERYDFKVGIDFIASSHFEWYQNLDASADTREKKAEAIKKSYQYMLDNFYNQPAALVLDGHALLFLFGGCKPDEFKNITAHPYQFPSGVKDYWYVLRANVGWYPSHTERGYRRWAGLVHGCFGWLMLPHRLSGKKTDPEIFKTYDHYIDSDDIVEYVRAVIDKNDEYYRKGVHKIRVSSACPGFDNRGCAGWSRKLAYIPREKGRTYRRQWDLNVENRDKIDVVFCVTWNDYTEATSVEPTVEFGFDDMEVTQKYAAAFKGIPSDPSGIRLPARLFRLRKKGQFLARTGFDTQAFVAKLDRAAKLISNREYPQADALLKEAESLIAEMETQLTSETLTVRDDGPDGKLSVRGPASDGTYSLHGGEKLYLRLDEGLAKKLRTHNWDGILEFEYFDFGDKKFRVTSSPARPDVPGPRHVANLYSVVCEIKKDGGNRWKDARVRLFKVNTRFDHKAANNSDIVFSGDATIRGIRLHFDVFSRR